MNEHHYSHPQVTELALVRAPIDHDDFANLRASEREMPEDYPVCIIEAAKEVVKICTIPSTNTP